MSDFRSHVSNYTFCFHSFQFISDSTFGTQFFSGFLSTLLYYDMLYKNGCYEQILAKNNEAIQQCREKSINSARFLDALVFGSCYKLVSFCFDSVSRLS